MFNIGQVATKMTQIRPDQAKSSGAGPPGAGSLLPKMRGDIVT
jgi:hypothetical protein